MQGDVGVGVAVECLLEVVVAGCQCQAVEDQVVADQCRHRVVGADLVVAWQVWQGEVDQVVVVGDQCHHPAEAVQAVAQGCRQE